MRKLGIPFLIISISDNLIFNSQMVKPYQLTYLARGDGGMGMVATPSLNLNHYLFNLLLIVNL